MTTTGHEAFLAYAPRGAGLLCAVCYFKDENGVDLSGWWIGFKDHGYVPAYFTLQNFYTLVDTAFLATEGSDLYGGWRYNYSRSRRCWTHRCASMMCSPTDWNSSRSSSSASGCSIVPIHAPPTRWRGIQRRSLRSRI